jgi:hypothetical protein
MVDLTKHCKATILSAEKLITDFDCGDADLNEFFNNDALHYKNKLLSQTIFFRHNETGKVVCAFSLSPNAMKTADLPGSRRKKVRNTFHTKKPCHPILLSLLGGLELHRNSMGRESVRN